MTIGATKVQARKMRVDLPPSGARIFREREPTACQATANLAFRFDDAQDKTKTKDLGTRTSRSNSADGKKEKARKKAQYEAARAAREEARRVEMERLAQEVSSCIALNPRCLISTDFRSARRKRSESSA